MKGSAKSVRLKYLLYAFCAFALVTLPLRVYQLLTMVESETGFYSKTDFSVGVYFVLLALFAVGSMYFSYISAEVPSSKLGGGKNRVLGASSAILGVGLLCDIVGSAYSLVKSVSETGSVLGLTQSVSAQGGVITIIRIAAAFLGAVYLFVMAVSHFNGRASYREYKVLALMPLLWTMCRMVGRLTIAISYVKVSELLLEIAMLVFLMLFFMNFARVTSGISAKGNMWGIFGFGLPAVLLALNISLPRLVVLLSGNSCVKDYAFNFADFALAVFIFVYILAALGAFYSEPVREKTVHELMPELPSEADGQTEEQGL